MARRTILGKSLSLLRDVFLYDMHIRRTLGLPPRGITGFTVPRPRFFCFSMTMIFAPEPVRGTLENTYSISRQPFCGAWPRRFRFKPSAETSVPLCNVGGLLLFSYPNLKHGDVLDYTYFWGGCSSCKRKFLIEYGVFNPVFRFGCEDIELAYRLSKSNLKVVYNARAVSTMVRDIFLLTPFALVLYGRVSRSIFSVNSIRTRKFRSGPK